METVYFLPLVNTSPLSLTLPSSHLSARRLQQFPHSTFSSISPLFPTQFLINAIWLSLSLSLSLFVDLSLSNTHRWPLNKRLCSASALLSTTLMIPVFRAAPRRRTNFTFLPSRSLPSPLHFSCIPLIHQRAITLLFPAASINPLSSIPSLRFVPLRSPSSLSLSPSLLLVRYSSPTLLAPALLPLSTASNSPICNYLI